VDGEILLQSVIAGVVPATHKRRALKEKARP
jgi:hypothetical protein